ncbi:MAG: hypothetical protein LBS93_05045, partial [Synergistaceae bacterium]|nr:hypothetical protein [Synergistaceae bacterium]
MRLTAMKKTQRTHRFILFMAPLALAVLALFASCAPVFAAPANSWTLVGSHITSSEAVINITDPLISNSQINIDVAFTEPTLTINGGGNAISFGALGAFKIDNPAVTVTFIDVVFIGDAPAAGASAVRIDDAAKVSFNRCAFLDNKATDGGAIYNAGSSTA